MKTKNSKFSDGQKSFFVIANNIRSLYNVGSIFRTADAFGVSKIFLTGYTGTPQKPEHAAKIGKVALGAETWVPWEQSATAFAVIRKLKKIYPQIRIIGLENNIKAQSLNKYKAAFPLALILGEEREGIAKSLIKLCDDIIEIPMSGKKESLNVSVAFGIAAYKISNT